MLLPYLKLCVFLLNQGPRAAMADPGTPWAMADKETRAAMAVQETPWAMVGSPPPPKTFSWGDCCLGGALEAWTLGGPLEVTL